MAPGTSRELQSRVNSITFAGDFYFRVEAAGREHQSARGLHLPAEEVPEMASRVSQIADKIEADADALGREVD